MNKIIEFKPKKKKAPVRKHARRGLSIIDKFNEINKQWHENEKNFMQYDFETVALHELGHCFQLGHDGDPQELMYPTNRNGETKRTITPNAISGALSMKASAIDRKGIHYAPMKWIENKNKTHN